MITDATKRRTSLTPWGAGRNWFRFTLFVVGLLAALFVCVGWWSPAPAAAQIGDLRLLKPESIARIQAAAKAGDIVAQSTLGTAYLQGKRVRTNVTKAVYWLRKVADRDRSEFNLVKSRIQFLVERRGYELDPIKQRAVELEYLDLAQRKLAFERAFLGLIQIYAGRQGASYADAELALKHMRSGADYGFPSAQRLLGIVNGFGLLGVPRNEINATKLLCSAAAKGDRVAQRLLAQSRCSQEAMLRARIGTTFAENSFS